MKNVDLLHQDRSSFDLSSPPVSVNPGAPVIITPRVFTVPRADNIGGAPFPRPLGRLVRAGRVSLLHPATAAAAAVGFVPPLVV